MKFKHFLKATAAFVSTVCLGAISTSSAKAVGLINGDFQTGDLTGWTVFTTNNGTNGSIFTRIYDIPQCSVKPLLCYGDRPLPDVTSFDVTDNGVSESVRFNVGSNYINVDANGNLIGRGGGIIQEVTLSDGVLNISVDVAASTSVFSASNTSNNFSAGVFSLLVNGIVVSTYDPGSILNQQTLRSTLTASTNVNAGNNSIGIQITRPFSYNAAIPVTPFQFVDNFTISGSATNSPAVPEPFSVIGTLIGGAAALRMRKKLR